MVSHHECAPETTIKEIDQTKDISEHLSVDESTSESQNKGKGAKAEPTEPWPKTFDDALAPFLSEEAISQLKNMFLEGQEPPRISDSGWGARPPMNNDNTEGSSAQNPSQEEPPIEKQARGRRGRERGARGARGGGRGGRGGGQQREDTRKVLSNVRAFELCLLLLILKINLTPRANSPCLTKPPALGCIRL